MDVTIPRADALPVFTQDVHNFAFEEVMRDTPQLEQGMAQLIDPDGKRDIICTAVYAEFISRCMLNWTFEKL